MQTNYEGISRVMTRTERERGEDAEMTVTKCMRLPSAIARQHPLLRCRRPSGEGALRGNSGQSLLAYLSVDTLNNEPIMGKLERDLARRIFGSSRSRFCE